MNRKPVATEWPPLQEVKVTASPRSRKRRASQLLRKFHLSLGMVFTLSFLVILVTGILVQHRSLFSLESRTVSRKWLPAGYRPNDPDTEIRADIVMTDLHSGRLFGPRGPLVVDAAAVAWLLMMCSGYAVQLVSRYRNGKNT